MTTTMTFVRYTVGGFSESGRTVSGGTHATLAAARAAMEHFRGVASVACMSVYGYETEADFECGSGVEVDGWSR